MDLNFGLTSVESETQCRILIIIQSPQLHTASATVVTAKPFSHGTGTLRCLQKEMATYRHWSVSCGETQAMSHIVESSPLTKLNGGLSRLHCADEDAVSWLTNYGKWHAYEKKKKKLHTAYGTRQSRFSALFSCCATDLVIHLISSQLLKHANYF